MTKKPRKASEWRAREIEADGAGYIAAQEAEREDRAEAERDRHLALKRCAARRGRVSGSSGQGLVIPALFYALGDSYVGTFHRAAVLPLGVRQLAGWFGHLPATSPHRGLRHRAGLLRRREPQVFVDLRELLQCRLQVLCDLRRYHVGWLQVFGPFISPGPRR